MKITLIDDDNISIFIAEKVLNLADKDIEINSFLSPVDALQSIKTGFKTNKLPDLILLDLNMPEINGFQFLEKLYKYGEEYKKINVCILTSSSSAKDIEQANSFESVVGFITKPLNLNAWNDFKVKISDTNFF